MSKSYVFDADDAIKYGLDAAVVLHAIKFWIEKNQANGSHFYDGHYWTYNSKRAWAELFPFFTERQVRRILDNLVEQGVLITGNYNAQAFDRTLWYALDQTVQSISPNPANGLAENGSPIPDSIPDNIPDKDKPKGLSTRDKHAETKSPYGEFGKVMLTDEEYERALAKYDGDPDKLEFAINILDTYIAQDKKRERRYTSHYAVLAPKSSWVRREVEERYVPRRYIEKDFDDTVIKVF